MKVYVDFFKPLGKWYAGGAVEMEEVKAWDGPEEKLAMIWKNQNFLQDNHRDFWTIVVDDLDSERNKPEYNLLWKRVLQIGKDTE